MRHTPGTVAAYTPRVAELLDFFLDESDLEMDVSFYCLFVCNLDKR